MADEIRIPMLDLAPLHARLRRELDAAISRVLDSNRFVLGDALTAFEQGAAAYLGARHAIGMANGTDALLLALKAAGIQPEDEVITSAFTYFATVEAIVHAGAVPVFADIDPVSMTLNPRDVENRITRRTRALLPVHVFGQPADMPALMRIAHAHDLLVIEDAAQAFGAKHQDRMAGTLGHAGCFSFHPSKPLGALGDGGMVVTDDDDLAGQLRMLRDHGATAPHQHGRIGYNSRLDEVQAAVLAVKLRHLDTHLAERDRLAAGYRKRLAGAPVQLPLVPPRQRHVFAQFTIRSSQRDHLRKTLAAAGIASAVHYPLPLYCQPALSGRFDADVELSVTEDTCRQCLSLPFYEGLSENQQQRIAAIVCDALDTA